MPEAQPADGAQVIRVAEPDAQTLRGDRQPLLDWADRNDDDDRPARPDVARRRRAENRVDERVSDHIAVRVPGQAPGRVQLDSAEDESPALDELVSVGAETDSHPSGSCRRLRP